LGRIERSSLTGTGVFQIEYRQYLAYRDESTYLDYQDMFVTVLVNSDFAKNKNENFQKS
jgi:hypothetical protein